MYIVIRKYGGAGASELMDTIEQRSDDVKEVISGTPGFISYAAFREGDGGITITACQDKAGVDESSERAATWVKENHTADVDPPEITEGPVFIQF
jgi:hypothetical protein